MWHRLTIALTFLTVFRLNLSEEITPLDSAQCYSFFPLVGFLVGLSILPVVILLQPLMPPLLLAVLTCALTTLVTRGFHLDGLADLADGVGGGYTPERRLEIMKDSSTGAFGSLAIVFAIMFKVGAIHTLIMAKSWAPFVLAPALSRLAIVLTAYGSPYARPEGGLAKSCVDHMTLSTVIAAALTALGLNLVFAPGFTPAYAAAVIISSLFMRSMTYRWLGGFTGDVLGAASELTEVVIYTLSACFVYSRGFF